MKRLSNLLTVVAILSICLLAGQGCARGGGAEGQTKRMPGVGDVAPDFRLKSNEGTDVGLRDYHGRWVVLYFYPKDFTSGCTLEARSFQRDLPAYEERNAIILGVSVDTAESHQSFCSKEGLTFKLLSDTDAKVSTAYGSITNLVVKKLSARNTFIVDPEGRIAKVYTNVSVGGHSREIIAALDELRKSRT